MWEWWSHWTAEGVSESVTSISQCLMAGPQPRQAGLCKLRSDGEYLASEWSQPGPDDEVLAEIAYYTALPGYLWLMDRNSFCWDITCKQL